MCPDAFRYIDIGNTVSVGQQKTLVADILLHTFQAASRLGVQTCINHGYSPVLRMVIQYFYTIIAKIDCHITIMAEVIGKIFLDDILLIATTDDKILNAVMAVSLHDVPQDGLPSDFNHRFGDQIGRFAQTRTEATGKNHRFHFLLVLNFTYGKPQTP